MFLHIGFTFGGRTKTKELEPALNKALDWVRYAPNCYLVYTSSTPHQWYNRLRPLLAAGEFVLIVEVQLGHRYGYLPRGIWKWIGEVEQRAGRAEDPGLG